MPELRFAITQQQKSVLTVSIMYDGPLTQELATLAVLAEESLSVQHQVNLTVVWMNDTGGTHRSRHSKRMDNTSLFLIFIFMIGTYPSLFKCLVQLIT